VNAYALLALEALLFALVFGALSWLRGEGLPARFAWEVLGVTAVCYLLCGVTGLAMHPVLFLVLVYIITMRARLLVDVGNALSARGRYEHALQVFGWAQRLAADPFSQTLVRINTGVVFFRQKRFAEAIDHLSGALAGLPGGRGGPKLEAACRYNLGLAYLRTGQERQGREQLNQVIELLPNSLYARGAEAALRQKRDATT